MFLGAVRKESLTREISAHMPVFVGGVRGAIVVVAENRQVRILDEAFYISHSVNTLGERYESFYSLSR